VYLLVDNNRSLPGALTTMSPLPLHNTNSSMADAVAEQDG